MLQVNLKCLRKRSWLVVVVVEVVSTVFKSLKTKGLSGFNSVQVLAKVLIKGKLKKPLPKKGAYYMIKG